MKFYADAHTSLELPQVARSLRGTAARTNFNKEGVLCEEVAKLVCFVVGFRELLCIAFWSVQLRGESQDKYPASSAKSRKRRRSSSTAQSQEGDQELGQGTYVRAASGRTVHEQAASAPTSRVPSQIAGAAAVASTAASIQASSRAAAASALLSATSSMAALTLPAWPTGMSSGAQLCISSPSTPMHGLPSDMIHRAQAALPALPVFNSSTGDDALNVALDAFAQSELAARSEAKQRRSLDDPWACDTGGASASVSTDTDGNVPISAQAGTPSSGLHMGSSRAQPAIDTWFVSQRLRSFREHIEAKASLGIL